MSKVEWKTISSICVPLKKETLKQSELIDEGQYAVINSGTGVYGFYNRYNNEGNVLVVASRGENAGYISFMNQRFWAGGLCYPYRSKNEDCVLTKFLYYYLKSKEEQIMDTLVARGSIPALNKVDFDNYKVPIPASFDEQRQIVSQLDTFTTLIAKLESELTLRQKQYEFYREKLLNFDGDEEVEWKKLGEICDIGTGNNNREDAITDGLYPFFVRSKEVFRINKYLFDEEAVIIPGEGGIGDIFHYVSGKYGLHQRAYRIHPKACIYNCKYIYYYLAANFKQYIVQKSVSATVTSIRKPMLEDFCICIPSPELQQYIVDKLDTFTTLISKLESEITLRRKQYDYYREKLLTFE